VNSIATYGACTASSAPRNQLGKLQVGCHAAALYGDPLHWLVLMCVVLCSYDNVHAIVTYKARTEDMFILKIYHRKN